MEETKHFTKDYAKGGFKSIRHYSCEESSICPDIAMHGRFVGNKSSEYYLLNLHTSKTEKKKC